MQFNADDPVWAGVLAKRYHAKNTEYQKQLLDAFGTPENNALQDRYPLQSFIAAVDELSTNTKAKQHYMRHMQDLPTEEQNQRFTENESAKERMANYIKLQQSKDILIACVKELEEETEILKAKSSQIQIHMKHLYE